MAVFAITTFSAFAGLPVAAQKLATDPDILNRVKALADLANDAMRWPRRCATAA